MAEYDAAEIGSASDPDYADHVRTFDSFVSLAKYSTIGLVILLILMAIFLL